MNWDAVGAIAELLGAAAVVLTLIYLSTQIRQNNQNLKNSTSWSINQGLAELNKSIRSDAELADIFIRGREDINSLDVVETERFRVLIMDLVNLALYVHNLKKTQQDDPLHYDMAEITGQYYQQYPGIRAIIDSAESITPAELLAEFRATPEPAEIFKKDGDV